MKKLIAITALFCLYAGWAAAAEPFSAEGVQVIDGDTIRVEVLHLGWGVALTKQTIRAADYDAWESSYARKSVDVTAAEIIKGKRATAVLAELLRTKRLRIEPAIGRDRDVYGRLLGVWTIVDGEAETPMQPFAELMQAGGHCRE